MNKEVGFDWNQSYSGDVTDYAEPDSDLLHSMEGLEPGRALDIGCGAGGLIVALAQLGWKVTGIDVAETAIASARAVAQQRGITAKLFVANATTWRPEGQYDLISSSFLSPGDERGSGLGLQDGPGCSSSGWHRAHQGLRLDYEPREVLCRHGTRYYRRASGCLRRL